MGDDEMAQDRERLMLEALHECVWAGVSMRSIETLARECQIPLSQVLGWRTPRATTVPNDANPPF